jgi:hypothetical protein
MTNANGVGIVLEYTFRDSFCFHIRLVELFDTQMTALIERLAVIHGGIVSISEPMYRR